MSIVITSPLRNMGQVPLQGANCRQRGFTIIEILMAIALLAVLMSLAAPNMINLVRDQRVKTATADLYASLIYTRSEAITRNQFVKMCAANSTLDGCGNTTNWAAGWIVFLDANDDDYPNAASDILKKQDAFTELTLTGNVDRVSYQRDGRLKQTTNPQLILSSSINSSVTARCVSVDIGGRPNIKVDTNSNAADGCQ